jgi:hypothetical protein
VRSSLLCLGQPFRRLRAVHVLPIQSPVTLSIGLKDDIATIRTPDWEEIATLERKKARARTAPEIVDNPDRRIPAIVRPNHQLPPVGRNPRMHVRLPRQRQQLRTACPVTHRKRPIRRINLSPARDVGQDPGGRHGELHGASGVRPDAGSPNTLDDRRGAATNRPGLFIERHGHQGVPDGVHQMAG